MIKDIFRFYLKLFVFAIVLAAIHNTLHYFNFYALSNQEFYRIHGFNFLASVLLYPILAYAFEYVRNKAGFVYLGLSIFKMLLAMIFMAIIILPKDNSVQSFAIQFLITYSFYLIFETLITVKKLNS